MKLRQLQRISEAKRGLTCKAGPVIGGFEDTAPRTALGDGARCLFVDDWDGTRPQHVCGLPVVRGHYCATHADVMYRPRPAPVELRVIKGDGVPHHPAGRWGR